jgi:hypothetical protein
MAQDPLAQLGVPDTSSSVSSTSSADPLAALGTPDVPDQQTSGTPEPTFNGPVAQTLGKIGEGGAEGFGDLWNMVKSTPAGIWHAIEHPIPDALLHPIDTFHTDLHRALPIVDAYEKARSGGKSIIESLSAANDQARSTGGITGTIAQKISDLQKNPTREGVRDLTDVVGILAASYGLGKVSTALFPEEGAVAALPVESETAAATAKIPTVETEFNSATKPSLYQQVTQSEKVAQAPAQEALQTAVKSGGNEVGLSTVQPASLRTIVEEPISAVNGLKKSAYGQVDEAAGTDLKTLYGKLDAINDKIDLEASGSPEEARLEAQRTSQMQTIEDAKQVARSKGVDVDKMLDKGDALHTKEMALREFQKNYLKNPSIIEGNSAMGTPETANVDAGIKVLQKMQDNTKYGAPRLEQALGKQGANQLLKDMYAAQRLGVKAIDAQKMMDRIIKGIKITGYVGGLGTGAYELLK